MRTLCATRTPLWPCMLLLAGCAADASTTAITVRDSAGVQIVENDLARLADTCAISATPKVSIGTAEGDEAYQLYRVFGASKLSDGRIVLVNQGSQQLRYYDASGKHITSAGRAGRGPGEFQDAFYLWVLPGDTIWVGDYRPWQFHLYGPGGEFVRTIRPTPQYANPPGVLQVLSDGRAILADRSTGTGVAFEPRRLTVVMHSPAGELIDTVGTYLNGRWGKITDEPGAVTLYPLFESFARVAAAGSRIVAGHGSEAQLTVIDASTELRPIRLVRWTTTSREITPDDVDAERARQAEPYANADPELRRRLLEPLISDKRPVAEQFPAFASVMIGRDGAIWVQEFTRPREPGTRGWTAYDEQGRFVCRARPPEVEQILEFGADYLLALTSDEMDVERVVEYSLTKPVAR